MQLEVMKQSINQEKTEEMRPEYDFSQSVREKHHQAYQQSVKIID